MKTIFKSGVAAIFALSISAAHADTTLSSILSSSAVQTVVEAVTGGETISTSSVAGDWSYSQPAVALESDNVLTEAAGTALTSKAESTLSTYCSKVGITAGKFSLTLGSDSSFSFVLSSKSLSGTYTIDGSSIALAFQAVGTVNLGTISAQASLSGDSLSLLFEADKLLEITSALSSSSNASISAVSSLLSSYDGVSLGFQFSKSSTTASSTTSTSTTTSTSSSVSSAVSAASSLFK